jgi:hypothetical protein
MSLDRNAFPSFCDEPPAHGGRIAGVLLIGLIGMGFLLTRTDGSTAQHALAHTLTPAPQAADVMSGADPPTLAVSTSLPITTPDRASTQPSAGQAMARPVASLPKRADQTRAVEQPPTLQFSTYLGGSAIDLSTAIAVDRDGYVYVAGQTLSDDFPTQTPAQAYQGGPLVGADAFVAKFSPAGDSLLYATYLGGSMGEELVAALAVDEQGRAYVAGTTTSMDFPTQHPVHGFRPGPQAFSDAFVARLRSDGTAIDFATYLGGTGDETATALALDDDGAVYVAGTTTSTDFPTTSGVVQPTRPDDAAPSSLDGFIARLAPTGNALALDRATYLGGTRDDIPHALAIDADGHAWVAGGTTSTDFPTHSALQPTYAGPIRDLEGDAFVARLSPDATALDVSTYLGGNQDDQATGLALDADGQVVLTGTTMSSDFPTTPGAYQPQRQAVRERFVAWLEPSGGGWALAASTRLSAPGGFETGRAGLAVDRAGHVWVAGATTSDRFPTQEAVQSVYGGGENDAFLARLDASGQTLGYATFLGGHEADVVTGLALGPEALCLTGGTGSSDFPLQAALQSAFDGPSTGGQRLTSTFVACFQVEVGDQPIPVELTAFEGFIEEGAVVLRWSTASETNNAGFEVQQRANAGNEEWSALAFVEGAGTTTEPRTYQYRVPGLRSGVHRFRLKQIDADGAFSFSPVVEVDLESPKRFALHGAYPNPSRGRATIPFDVAQPTSVRLTVYDALGRKQAVLIDKDYEPGRYTVRYDGRHWASGVYFFVIEMGDFRDVQQVVVLR